MVRPRTRSYSASRSVKRRRTMAPATARKLASLRTPELKYKDFSLGAGLTNANIQQIRVTQGDDGDDYTGAKLFMERIDTVCNTDDADPAALRLTVLMPKDPTSAPVALGGVTSRYDERQFTILYDELIPPTAQNMAARRRVNIKRMQEKITAVSDTVIKGNLYVCWNFASAVSTNLCTTRLYFTDN